MGVSEKFREKLRTNERSLLNPNGGFTGFGVSGTNRIWLNATAGVYNPNAFRSEVDLAAVIVHEMLHKVLQTLTEEEDDPVTTYNDQIQENCGDSTKRKKL